MLLGIKLQPPKQLGSFFRLQCTLKDQCNQHLNVRITLDESSRPPSSSPRLGASLLVDVIDHCCGEQHWLTLNKTQ